MLPILARPGTVPFFFSQRIDGRPFVNCLPYSICPVLRWMGYDVPDTYGMTLRKASGVPVAEHKGTSYADMRKALAVELPTAPITIGALAEADFLLQLPRRGKRNRRKAVASVIARMELLPSNMRRLVGHTWRGLHGISIAGYRECDGTDPGHAGHAGVVEVWWMDPMGRTFRGYSGEWAAWDAVKGSIQRTPEGLIRCAYGTKASAA